MNPREPPFLVAIVGGSGSGKSWLAGRLQAALGEKMSARLSLDDFYLDRSQLPPKRRAKINFDHPRAIDWPGVERVLRDWLAGRPARPPGYDFKTHCRCPSAGVLKPKPILLMEGLWLLRRRSIRRLFDLSIFLDCPAGTRLRRRVARDLQTRGRTRASVLEQFHKTVEPMHLKHVAPQVRLADVVLSGQCGQGDVNRLATQLLARRAAKPEL